MELPSITIGSLQLTTEVTMFFWVCTHFRPFILTFCAKLLVVKDRQYDPSIFSSSAFEQSFKKKIFCLFSVIFIQTKEVETKRLVSNYVFNPSCFKEWKVQTSEMLLFDNPIVTETSDTDTAQTAQYTVLRHGWQCGTAQRMKQRLWWIRFCAVRHSIHLHVSKSCFNKHNVQALYEPFL